MTPSTPSLLTDQTPDIFVDPAQLFGVDLGFRIPAFSTRDEHVPEIDETYLFDPSTTKALLSGFAHNNRVMVQGYHGTGKSTHIEQIAARLNWPLIRINLDSHISRIDLIGKDAIVLKDGKQITEFREGLLPWALQRPVALVFDEYDAGRPDIMFVLQRILETKGRLTLLDQNRVLTPHPFFRLFATANTIGLGDTTGLYHGTQQINQAQMDRWSLVATLNYLSLEQEVGLILPKIKALTTELEDQKLLCESHFTITPEFLAQMVTLAQLTRKGFAAGELSTLMSPRTVLHWAKNSLIFSNPNEAFCLSFLNKCDEMERPLIAEYYQRCFAEELCFPSSLESSVTV